MVVNRDPILKAKDLPEPDRLVVRSMLIVPNVSNQNRMGRASGNLDIEDTKTQNNTCIVVVRDTATGSEYLILLGDGQITKLSKDAK